MAARCFHEVNGGGVKHGGRVRPWLTEDSSEVVLGVLRRLTPVRFFGRTGVPPATQEITSVQHAKQVGGDFINGSVPVDSVEESALIIPSSKRRCLFVVGTQSVEDGVFVVIRSTLFLVVSARASIRRNGVERIVVYSTAIAAG